MTTKRSTSSATTATAELLQELRTAVAHVSDTAADDACACRPIMLAIAGDVVERLSQNGIPLALAVPTLALVAEYFFDIACGAVHAATEDEAVRLQADELLEALHEAGMNALPELKGRLMTVVGTSDEIGALRALDGGRVPADNDDDEELKSELDPEDYGAPFRCTKGGDA